MFRKILIANRGEIAVRIIRACRELGIIPAVVYSEIDRDALHVRLADEAYEIGHAHPRETYLVPEKIIQTALACGAEAIHPGYGFLSENPDLPKACDKEGLIFIGPSAKSMEIMRDKPLARKTAKEADVPVVPGGYSTMDLKALKEFAATLGYPVVLKAAFGGAGRGMRTVESPEKLGQAVGSARAEAKTIFSNESLYIEQYLPQARHIEIQILADKKGKILHLWERECSIQRRYQKLVEEAPACDLKEEIREKMLAAAIKLTGAVKYHGSGTVEFLLDRNGEFYFLELNDQDEISCNGAAIEFRIYAEDAQHDFRPCPGRIQYLYTPDGPGVRVDSGIIMGSHVTIYYDPLLAKVITWGKNRDEALKRMSRAIEEYQIEGIITLIPFYRWLLKQKPFLQGQYNTSFISDYYKPSDLQSIIQDIEPFAKHIPQTPKERPVITPSVIEHGNLWKLESYLYHSIRFDHLYIIYVYKISENRYQAIPVEPTSHIFAPTDHYREGSTTQQALFAVIQEVLETMFPHEIFSELEIPGM
jgi:acetyl-CoA carboxylase biotin carboxylase subunit